MLALEKLSIAEARRSFTYFHLFGYPSDLVIANRVFPPETGGYFAPLRAMQQRYPPEVEREFGPVPVRTVPFFDREMVGFERLREVGLALFGDDDPSAVYYRGRPYQVRRDDGTYLLTLELPFTSRDEVKITRHADELVLQVGGWRRTLILPRVLVDAPTRAARMEDQTLRIEFEARSKAGARGGKS